MNTIRASTWAACLILVSALPAAAQNNPGSGRPITFGVGGTVVATWLSSGFDLRATISVPIRERISLEFFAGPFRGSVGDDLAFNVKGFYGAQVKREIDRGRRPGVTPFLTFGGAGIVSRQTKYDCSFANCGRRQVMEVLPPMLGMFGAGVELVVAPRLAVRLEAQGIVALVIPAGVRASASLTIPLSGRYVSSARR